MFPGFRATRGGRLPGALAILGLLAVMSNACAADEAPIPNVALAIHGGIAPARGERSAEHEKTIRAELTRALEAGYATLQKRGATSLDAVEAAIRVLEDSPHFNAGKGSVFTHEGKIELDASIMEGKELRAGAVACASTIKNPITGARAVMEKSKHVLLVGPAADSFASKVGVEVVDPSYFWTEPRWRQIQETWKKEKDSQASSSHSKAAAPFDPYGTVGAVAVDSAGNLAAGTSTGGRNNKMSGRVGDSPILGAGTYADNQSCAVSATGHGEFFIRYVAAHDIAALMRYKQLPVECAAAQVVLEKLKQAGGEGGLIALDAKGNLAMPYNTEGMYRGWVDTIGKISIRLYED